jgi:hypothetical protein
MSNIATTTTTTPSLLQQFQQTASSSGLLFPSAAQIKAILKGKLPANQINAIASTLGGQGLKATTTKESDIAAGLYTELLAATGNSQAANKAFQSILQHYGVNSAAGYNSDPTSKSYKNFMTDFKKFLSVVQTPTYGGNLGKIPANVITTAGPGGTLPLADQYIMETLAGIPAGMQAIAQAQATASSKISADSNLQATLQSWGLDSMAGLIDQWVFKDGITNTKELMNLVRNYKDPKTGVSPYEQAFPGLKQQQAEAAKGNTKPLTEAQYLTLTQSYQNTADAAGLPKGFLSPKELESLVAGNVSAAEFSRRIADGYQAVQALPQNLKDQFAAQHGVGTGGLLAYFLDPTKGEAALERQALAANLQGTAQNVGLTGFNSQQALDLAEMVRMATGGTGAGALQDPYLNPLAKATQALTLASKDQPLTVALPGQAAPTVDTKTLIGSQIAGYEGTNQAAAQLITQRAEQAYATPFEKGGGFEETGKGVIGLGAART